MLERRVGALDLLLHPPLLRGLLDVHVLHADGAAVGVAQHAQQVTELHPARLADGGINPGLAAGQELAVEVPDGQPVGGWIELGVHDRGLVAQRIEVGYQMAPHPVLVDELVDLGLLLEHRRFPVHGVDVAPPLDGLVGDVEGAKGLAVEVVLAQQQVVNPPQEQGRLGALDDAMVVGARDGQQLAHAQIGQQGRVGGLVLGGERQHSDTDDRSLPDHQSGHGLPGAEGAGVRDGDGDAAHVVGAQPVLADLGDLLVVTVHEGGEVEGVSVGDARHHQRAGAVVAGDVDCDAQADVIGSHDPRLALRIGGEDVVHGRHRVRDGSHDRVADQVGERDLAHHLAAEVAVYDLAVDLQELGGDIAEARGRRHGQAGLHVDDDPGADASDRLAYGRVVGSRCRLGRGRVVGRIRRGSALRPGLALGPSGHAGGGRERGHVGGGRVDGGPGRGRRSWRGGRGALRSRSLAFEEGAPGVVHRCRVGRPQVAHLVEDPGVGAQLVACLGTSPVAHGERSYFPAGIWLACAGRQSAGSSADRRARVCCRYRVGVCGSSPGTSTR